MSVRIGRVLIEAYVSSKVLSTPGLELGNNVINNGLAYNSQI
jgi:hypothetical protein